LSRVGKALAASAVAVAALLGAAGTAAAETVTVCKAGPPDCDFDTITEGIAEAKANDTVTVGPGTYEESVKISTQGVTLVSTDGAAATIIRGPYDEEPFATVWIAANNVTVDGFTITRSGNTPSEWPEGVNKKKTGVAIQQPTIQNALVQNNIITANRTGVDINNSSGHTLRNNAITNNRTGLFVRNATDNLTVENNRITNNWTLGVLLGQEGETPAHTYGSRFYNNDISGNWYGQIVDRQTATPNVKDFRSNWLGTTEPTVVVGPSSEPGYSALIPKEFGGPSEPPASAPTITGEAAEQVAFSPFLWTDDNSATGPGFDGDFSELGVSAEGAEIGGDPRIQVAIDDYLDRPGIVNVLEGTFPGNLTINGEVGIAGAGQDATTLTPTTNVSGNDGWIEVKENGAFELSDLTLDGDGRNIANGIRYRDDTEGDITRVTFRNIANGDVIGTAVSTNDGGANPPHADIQLDVTNSTFENIGRIGVLFKGDGVTGSFANNRFVGRGAGDNRLGYGVEVSAGAKATVTGNTITGNLGTKSNEISAAVYASTLYGDGTEATVTGNTLTGNSVGIYVGYKDNADTSQVTARGNRIVDNGQDGAYAAPGFAGSLDAQQNWWGCNAGPGSAGCDSVTGPNIDASSPLQLSVSASPNVVGLGGGATVTASLGAPDGTPVSFATDLGTLSSTSGQLASGSAAVSYTATQPGSANVSATVDNQTVSTGIVVPFPPPPEPEPTPTPAPVPPASTQPPVIGEEQSVSPPAPTREQVREARSEAQETLGARAKVDRAFDLGGKALVLVPTVDRNRQSNTPVVRGSQVRFDPASLRRGQSQNLLALSCPTVDCTAKVTITIRYRDSRGRLRTIEVAASEQEIAAGGVAAVTLNLPRSVRQQILRGGNVRMTVAIDMQTADGQPLGSDRRTLSLKTKKSKRNRSRR